MRVSVYYKRGNVMVKRVLQFAADHGYSIEQADTILSDILWSYTPEEYDSIDLAVQFRRFDSPSRGNNVNLDGTRVTRV